MLTNTLLFAGDLDLHAANRIGKAVSASKADCLCYTGYNVCFRQTDTDLLNHSIFTHSGISKMRCRQLAPGMGYVKWACSMMDDGVSALADVMDASTTLKGLVVHFNNISIRARDCFLDALDDNKHKYTSVGLSGAMFSDEQMQRLAGIVAASNWETLEIGPRLAGGAFQNAYTRLVPAILQSQVTTLVMNAPPNLCYYDAVFCDDYSNGIRQIIEQNTVTRLFIRESGVVQKGQGIVGEMEHDFNWRHVTKAWCLAMLVNTALLETNITLVLNRTQLGEVVTHSSLTTLWVRGGLASLDFLTGEMENNQKIVSVKAAPNKPQPTWEEWYKRLESFLERNQYAAACASSEYILK